MDTLIYKRHKIEIVPRHCDQFGVSIWIDDKFIDLFPTKGAQSVAERLVDSLEGE